MKALIFWSLVISALVAFELFLYCKYREQITCDNFREAKIKATVGDVNVWTVDRFPFDTHIACARGVYPHE